MPVVGFLSSASSSAFADRVEAFRQGLSETGYIEGRNVIIEYRWADFEVDRLPALAADLVKRQVSVIATFGGTSPVLAAKSATSTIPIVFGAVSEDPVRIGLVSSLGRPGGNVTGIVSLGVEIGPKRLELLRELIPTATVVAALLNRNNVADAEGIARGYRELAHSLGVRVHILDAGTEQEIDQAFATLAQLHAGGLVIAPDPFFNSKWKQIAALSVRYALPAVFQFREFATAGGLISYGANLADGWRAVGVYAGRILKGDRPANLPVQQATRVELIINLKTAKALGITVPLPLLGRADEVIE